MENNGTIDIEVRTAIEAMLKEYETEYNINIFFACDTGSRALGVAVESSDFDLNAFFIAKEDEYLQVVRKAPNIFAKQGMKLKVAEKIYEIDIQIWDLKDWLKEKVLRNVLGCDYYFTSPIIYRNEKAITEEIRKYVSIPFFYFWGKFRNNYLLCEKDILKEGTQNKKLMNMLIYAVQYLHSRVYNEPPFFNIFEEINFIANNKNKLETFLDVTSEDIETMEKCFEFIQVCYEEKKKGRKSLTKEIPDFVKKFVNFLDTKLNVRTKKDELVNLFSPEVAQQIFDNSLRYYSNL